MNKEYLNEKLSAKERTAILLPQMTVGEKVGQLMQISSIQAVPYMENGKALYFEFGEMSDEEKNKWVVEKGVGSFLHILGNSAREIQKMALSTRLGIPVIFGIDAIHGHGLHNGATIFPSQLAVSCSWDKALVENMGRVTAKEVAADGLHWTFSPVLCIGRDLRWGRVDETFGEDPFLIGELGAAVIKGYQGEDLKNDDSILACAKHYLGYGESTGGRDSYDTEVSFRKMREVFLPPFKKAVDVGCGTFMTGYQSLDGNPATSNKKILREILKEELGFEGFVVTDWNNAESLIVQQRVAKDIKEASAMTILAGNDMIMNTPDTYEAIVEQVTAGIIPMEIIDESVERILYMKFKMGLFEKARKESISQEVFSCDEHLEVNLKLTRKSMVLLENKGDMLPLSSNIKEIAVVGPNAHDIQAQYGDWTYFSHPAPKAGVIAERPYFTMLEGITDVAKRYNVNVRYHKGCHIMDEKDEDIEGAVELAKEADIIVAVIGDCLAQNGEFKDRGNLELSGAQQKLLENLKATGKPLIVVLVNGKPLTIPWVKENADALIETFNSGMFGGQVVGEILFGETNPTGKLSISFAQHVGQLPVYYNQLPGWHGSKYMDLPLDVLYSFGYGLSFAKLKYDNLKLSQVECKEDDELIVSIDVTNLSKIDTEEVVQLYVNDVVSSVMSPVKQLKGFERVYVKAGGTKTVIIHLPIRDLYIVKHDETLVVEPGEFKIMVGPDSRDRVLLSQTINVI